MSESPKQRRPAGTGSVFYRGRIAWLAYRHNGEQLCESTKQTDRKVAEKMLREKLRTADTPAHITAKADAVTFDDVAALLLTYHEQKRSRSLVHVQRHVRQLREFFGGRWLAITEPRIERYKAAQLALNEQPGTINRRLADLRQMGRLAVRQKLVPSSPHVALLDESNNVREGFVEPADMLALLAHLPADIADGTEFAYHSAWRSQMVWGLKWSHCDLTLSSDGDEVVAASIRLPRANVKNKKPHTIPARGRLLDIIKRRWRQRVAGCDFVFHRNGKRVRDLRRAWKKGCDAAGLAGLRFHDLKRSAARNMRRAGKSEHVICKAAGWATASMFKRYDIVDEADLAELFDDTAAFVAEREKQPRPIGTRGTTDTVH
jgi:integrase